MLLLFHEGIEHRERGIYCFHHQFIIFPIAFKEAGEALGGLGGVQGTFEFSHQIDQVFSSCLLSSRREGDYWEGQSIGKEVRHSVHFSHHSLLYTVPIS